MPRRRDEDDEDDIDDDLPVRRKSQLSGMDAFFTNTSFPVLMLLGVCCSFIAGILAIVGLATCKDPTAKSNAMTTLIVSVIFFVIWNVVSCGLQFNQGAFR